MTLQLYNQADIKKVRKELLIKQSYVDDATQIALDEKDAVLDHDHKTQYVRGVLHRQVNVMLGKIENSYRRYMSYWHKPFSMPMLLRELADYVEKHEANNSGILHPRWIKKACTQFNKLKESDKNTVLHRMLLPEEKNSTKRKEAFKAALMSRNFQFENVMLLIDEYLPNEE